MACLYFFGLAISVCRYDYGNSELNLAVWQDDPIALGYVCSNWSNCRSAHDLTVDIETRGALMETDAPAILIVDDNEDNRYTLQLQLESDGHSRLATASGGHGALALLAREK
jgi:hypothetical protein